MSQVAGARYTCENCGKTFIPKPEWYGKRVKCRCGYIMTIPVPAVAKEEAVPDDMYDLAPEAAMSAKAKPHVAPPEVVAASTAKAMPAGGGAAAIASPVLGYRTQAVKKQEDRFSSASSTMMDPKRDLYVPVGLLIGGLLIYILYYATHYGMGAGGIAITAIGLSIMTAVKAAVLIGFAMIIAGPLGVSFGGIFTAALKLAAIAIFCDGATTWVDAIVAKFAGGGGFFDGMMSFPIALAIYWGLLIYLFSMDPGDSWMVVILLAVFDGVIRWVMLAVLMGVLMGIGGVSNFGGGGGPTVVSGAGGSSDAEYRAQIDDGSLQECLAYRKTHGPFMDQQTADFYAAGAKGCYYEVTRDINGKMSIEGYVVELPTDKAKREKVLKAIKDDYKARFNEEDDEEPEGNFINVSTARSVN